MSKDPSILFYTSDFLTGCSDLTMEERGQYITLLCLQHQKGEISPKMIKLNIGEVSPDVIKKFKTNENGNYYNERFLSETVKRKKYSESRQKNLEKSNKNDNENDTILQHHMEPHMENENENENRNKDENKYIFINSKKQNFEKVFKEIFSRKPFLGRQDSENLIELCNMHEDFEDTLHEYLSKLKSLDFEEIGIKPDASWFLVEKNYVALRNGRYDAKIVKQEAERQRREAVLREIEKDKPL